MNDLALVIAGGLVVALAAAVWQLLSTRRELAAMRTSEASADVAESLRRQLDAARSDARADQDAVRRELGALQLQVKEDLGALRLNVTGELTGVTAEVARQLQSGMEMFQRAQSTMGDRLDRAAAVVGEVQGSLGRLGEATARVVEIGRDIQGLEQLLKSPKLRGGVGETLLEQVLAQMLPREHYELQHEFRTKDRVDAVVRVGERMVPIDAKFPIESFRRVLAEPDEERRRVLRRTFGREVRQRVDEIAKKYILPDEGTFDFALMYVPAENVYYEMVIKDALDEGGPIAEYALSRRVVPVSPNSLFAYLQVIVLGLRGMAIEANAREIQGDLRRLIGDLSKVRDHMGKLGKHLANAQQQYSDAEQSLARFEARLEGVERRGEQKALPGLEDD